jgi:hypothetical protein
VRCAGAAFGYGYVAEGLGSRQLMAKVGPQEASALAGRCGAPAGVSSARRQAEEERGERSGRQPHLGRSRRQGAPGRCVWTLDWWQPSAN